MAWIGTHQGVKKGKFDGTNKGKIDPKIARRLENSVNVSEKFNLKCTQASVRHTKLPGSVNRCRSF